MGIFAKNYSVEELRKLGLKVEGDPKEVPLFDPEEYQEAREEMGEDFIEMERIDDYIEPDYYHNSGGDGADLIEMLYRTLPFEQFRGAMKINIIKYVTRYDRKDGPKDLKKAHTYLDRLRDYEEQHESAKRLDERESKEVPLFDPEEYQEAIEQGAELDKALDKLSDYAIPSFSEQLASKQKGEL